MLFAVGLHSFFEGIAFGVTDSMGEAVNLFIAITAHKWSDALIIGISFVAAKIEFKYAIRYMIFYAILTPLGVIIGYFVQQAHHPKLNGVVKTISAGTFIYLSCVEIINNEFASAKDKYWKFLCYMIGIIFIALIGLLE